MAACPLPGIPLLAPNSALQVPGRCPLKGSVYGDWDWLRLVLREGILRHWCGTDIVPGTGVDLDGVGGLSGCRSAQRRAVLPIRVWIQRPLLVDLDLNLDPPPHLTKLNFLLGYLP